MLFEIWRCPPRAGACVSSNNSLLVKRPRVRARPSNYAGLVLGPRAHARGTAFRKTQPLGVPWGGSGRQGCWHAPCDTLRYARSGIPCSKHGGVAQLVRALPCHGRGRGFESRRSRFCNPAFRVWFGVFGALFVGGDEVLREGCLWLDGNDRAVLLPDVLEECGDQLAPLGRVGLGFPESGEVFEERLGAIEVRRRGRRGALEFGA